MHDELAELWLLRHGQSVGNVANEAARTEPTEVLDIADRDMDVPLSDLGVEQSRAFGEWLGEQGRHTWPDAIVTSPYARALDTARHVVDACGMDVEVVTDERLREREFGIVDLLTHSGVVARFPTEAARRDRLGKFYYRPPGGESWVDVALRLRSLRDSIVREHAGRRLLIVTHEVPIIIMRYLIERLDEAAALQLSRSARIANCSLTTFVATATSACGSIGMRGRRRWSRRTPRSRTSQMLPSHPAEQRLDAALLRSWPLPDHRYGDKRERGTVLVVGGTARTPGAVILAGVAALRSGAGCLQLATAPAAAVATGVAVPEALVLGHDDRAVLADLVAHADAIVIGPGLDAGAETEELLDLVLEHAGPDTVLVVDAAAIPVLRARPDATAARSGRLVITPNREELASFVEGGAGGDDAAEADTADGAVANGDVVAAARRSGAAVVSFEYVAAADGRLWADPHEVVGLGTSGAGDVLAGLAGGFSARCHDAVHAACWAALTHRAAARRLGCSGAPLGYLARELADELSAAIDALTASPTAPPLAP